MVRISEPFVEHHIEKPFGGARRPEFGDCKGPVFPGFHIAVHVIPGFHIAVHVIPGFHIAVHVIPGLRDYVEPPRNCGLWPWESG
jgi:hypothetical protein